VWVQGGLHPPTPGTPLELPETSPINLRRKKEGRKDGRRKKKRRVP